MDEEDVQPGCIVFLKHGFFPDSNTIDYRLNGRPYLVYEVDGENVKLLKISSSDYMGEPFYYPISRKNSKNKTVESYIDLRFLIEINMTKLIMEYNAVLSTLFKKRIPKKMQSLTDKDFENVKELRKNMEIVEEFKIIYPLYPALGKTR